MADLDLVLIGRHAIEKESASLAELARSLDVRFAEAVQTIFSCRGTVLLTGMGKSGLVARKWASTFSSTGTAAFFVNPAEAPHGDLGILRQDDVLIALSFSGETDELGYVLRHAAELGLPTIGITGNAASSLARQVSLVLPLALDGEACPLGLAPTSSTTAMMAVGDALAIALMRLRGFTEKDFGRLHPGGSLGRKLWLRVGSLMHQGDEIPVVAPETPFETMLLEMTRKRLGLAVVKDGETVAGIITDGDLRRFFQKQDGRPFGALTAADVMTREPKTLGQDALAVEARELLEEKRIQHLLITDEKNALVGVIHLQDLLRAKVV